MNLKACLKRVSQGPWAGAPVDLPVQGTALTLLTALYRDQRPGRDWGSLSAAETRGVLAHWALWLGFAGPRGAVGQAGEAVIAEAGGASGAEAAAAKAAGPELWRSGALEPGLSPTCLVFHLDLEQFALRGGAGPGGAAAADPLWVPVAALLQAGPRGLGALITALGARPETAGRCALYVDRLARLLALPEAELGAWSGLVAQGPGQGLGQNPGPGFGVMPAPFDQAPDHPVAGDSDLS